VSRATPPSAPLGDALPPIYARLLPAFLATPTPVETLATCDSCAMCPEPADAAPAGGMFFSPDVKCCTYHPDLPNYLVGALLADPDPELEEGRRRIRARIAARVGVTPHGIAAPRVYRLLYGSAKRGLFGRTESLVCPYYRADPGACTIWRYREATCSTFFCKHVRGEHGSSFWAAVRDYLRAVEEPLALHAMQSLGCSPEQILAPRARTPAEPTPEDLDQRPPSDAAHAVTWGSWAGREEEFYVEAARLVTSLEPSDLDAITGVAARVQRALVEQRHAHMMDPELPDVLRRNPELAVPRVEADAYHVVGYSENQPMRLPRALYEALAEFDGVRPNEQVLTRIREERGLNVAPGLLVRLFQHRILV
jgi:hypothetical protein